MKKEEIFFFTNAARVWPLGHVPYRDRAARSDVVHLHICKDSVSEFTSKQPPSNVFMPDPGCEGWLLKKGKNSANLHNRQKTGKKGWNGEKLGWEGWWSEALECQVSQLTRGSTLIIS